MHPSRIEMRIGELMVQHPVITGFALAVLMGGAARSVYKIGLIIGELRVMNGDAARAASEALGG